MCPWCIAWLTERGAWQRELPIETTWDSATEWEPEKIPCCACGKADAIERPGMVFYCAECWYWRTQGLLSSR